MSVTHVLKDGTIKEDLRGHIVKHEYARRFYEELKKGRFNDYKRTQSTATIRGCGNE